MNEVKQIGTVICDRDQTILHADSAYADIVRRDRSDLIGFKALSFTYADDLTINQPLLDNLAGDGNSFTITKRYVRTDGGLIWVKNHVSRIGDGLSPPLLCATTERVNRPFGSAALARNYEAAWRLSKCLIAGRQIFTPDVVWAPGIELLLWLYRAEIEGRSLNIDSFAELTGTPVSIMVRWARLLQERGLLVPDLEGPLSSASHVRISVGGESRLDTLLSNLTA